MFESKRYGEEKMNHNMYTIPKQYFEDFSGIKTKKQLDSLEEDKHPVVVMINNPVEFFKRLKNALISYGFKDEEIIISRVVYYEKDSGFFSWIYPIELFNKIEDFKQQSELRIVINSSNRILLNQLRKENNIMHMGNLEDICSISEYYFKDVLFELKDKEVWYELEEEIVMKLSDLPLNQLANIFMQIYNNDVPTGSVKDKKSTLKKIGQILTEKYRAVYIDKYRIDSMIEGYCNIS